MQSLKEFIPRYRVSYYSSGFTLIELLVTIAIITILATIFMANFVGVRQRGRDGQRKSNMYQIQSALELYRSDIGSYPATLYTQNCPVSSSLANGGSIYMNEIPCDPLDDENFTYLPVSASNGSCDGVATACVSYQLIGCLENQSDQDAEPDTNNVCSSSNFIFQLENQ